VFLELYRYLTLSGPVQFWLNPAEAFWVAFINFWVVFMPGSVISLIAGWIVSEAAAARIKARS
jgi:general stress protein CsbA